MTTKKPSLYWSLFLLLFCLADILLTNKLVLNVGTLELNPVMDFFMKELKGLWWIPKLIITSIVIVLIWIIKKNWVSITILSIQGLVVLYSIYLLIWEK
jgi:fucose 4-O-acetylase-like acetyltransferase